MKRFLIICLSLLLIFSLCACEQEEPIEVVESPSVTDEPEVEPSTDEYSFKGDFLKEYSDEKYNGLDVNKFLGTAIVKLRPLEYQIADIPVISNESSDAERVFTLLHLDPDYLVNYAISASSNSTRAYTFAIMQAAPYCEELIVSAIETRVVDLYQQVKDYPDQLYLVENSIVTQLGDFVIFIICDNADMVLAELTEVFKSMDLDSIESVPYMTDEERKVIEDAAFENDTSDLFSDVGDVIVTPVEGNTEDMTNNETQDSTEISNTDDVSVDSEE